MYVKEMPVKRNSKLWYPQREGRQSVTGGSQWSPCGFIMANGRTLTDLSNVTAGVEELVGFQTDRRKFVFAIVSLVQ